MSLYSFCSSIIIKRVAYIDAMRHEEAVIFKLGFELRCAPSVVTDDQAVKHPRELQSRLMESREIERDSKAKDLL